MNNPWKGLACYEESDNLQYKFCGRDKSIRELATLIKNNLCITLYGRTGIGKTSLLKAGVFPALRVDNYVPVIVRFDDKDSRSYADYLTAEINRTVARVEVNDYTKATRNPVDDLWEYFATRHFYDEARREVFPVIVLDQFEENFLRPDAKQKAWLLMEQLYSLTDDNKAFPEGYHNETNFRIVISIREDDLFRLEDCLDSLNLSEFKYNRYRLMQLTDAEATDIITIPGANVLPADEAERDRIVRGIIGIVKGGSDDNQSTLMLSLVCSQLFEKARERGTDHITPDLVEGLSGNLLQGFYLDIIRLIPTERERHYLEDNLVDSHGRRNSINKDIVQENCPSWRSLAEGITRILQETNGKVEFVHDMLAQAVFEVREKRKEEQHLREVEREKEEMRRKNRRKMSLMAGVVLLAAGLISLMVYQNYKATKANWRMMESQSRAVAGKIKELLDEGDSYTAGLLALEILPQDLAHPDRPYTPEMEAALRQVMSSRSVLLKDPLCRNSSQPYSHDGKFFLSLSTDRSIRIWDIENGQEVRKIEGHDLFSSACFSPDDKYILSASLDSTIRLWNAITGEEAQRIKLENKVCDALFTPDGKRIISVTPYFGGYCSINMWDIDKRKEIWRFPEPIDREISLSADGKRIAATGYQPNTPIYILDVESGKAIKHLKRKNIGRASISPNGQRVVIGSWGDFISVYDIETEKELFAFRGDTTTFWNTLKFSPDGKYIVTDNQCWDAETGVELNTIEEAKASFCPDKKHFTQVINNGIRLYRLGTTDELRQFVGHRDIVCSASFSKDGKQIITASIDSTIRVWNTYTGKELSKCTWHTPSTKENHWGTRFSPDQKYIVSASYSDSIVRIWDAQTGKCQHTLKGYINYSFCPSGKYLSLTAHGNDSICSIWNIATGAEVKKVKKYIAISPDSTHTSQRIMDYLITTNLKSGKKVKLEGLDGFRLHISNVEFSLDGKRIASPVGGISFCLWDTDTGAEIWNTKTMAINSGTPLAFSPDGKYIVTYDVDEVLHIFDAETGCELQTFKGHTDNITAISFSPDGRYILSSSEDKTVRLWEFKPLQELIDEARERFKHRQLTPKERRMYYLE